MGGGGDSSLLYLYIVPDLITLVPTFEPWVSDPRSVKLGYVASSNLYKLRVRNAVSLATSP